MPPAPHPPPDPAAPPSPRGGAIERFAWWLYPLHLWTVFGLAVSNALLGLTLAASPWLLRRGSWTGLGPLLRPALFYLLVLLAAIGASYEPATSLPAVRETFAFGTLALAPLVLREERRLRLAVDGFIAVAAILAVTGLAQLLAGGGVGWRIRGPFSHYMTFAGVLLLADLLLFAQLACRLRRVPAAPPDAPESAGLGSVGHPRFGRWGWRLWALAPINLALLASLTRSAWVALILAVTVLVLLQAPRLLLAYVPAAVLFLLLAPGPVVHRALSIFDVRNVTNYDRLCMLEAGLHMVGERPLFGLGPEMVESRYPIYRHPTAPRQTVPHLHNSFLQLAAERGLLSLAAYLWLMAIGIRAAWRRYRRQAAVSGARTDLWLGAFVALVGFNLAGLFENNWGDSEVQRIALFLLAMPFCLPRGEPETGPDVKK